MIDLFAGTGAFTQALCDTNKVECVFANDITPWSKTIYDANHEHKLTQGDLNSIPVDSIPPHDILTGGFPCQPFSIAGKQEGFNDERSNVFWKIMEIIDYHEPSFIILENVRNLLSHDKGRTFEIIKKNLTDRGYLLRYAVLNTAEITGVPQHRERIYIVGIKSREIYDKFSLDFMKIPKEPISKYIMPDVAEKYWYTAKSAIYPLLYKEITKPDTIYQYRRVYIRENKSNECPTLTANMGTGGHNVPICLTVKGIRKLTPRECFSFPETYILPDDIADSKQYCLAGNAVSLIVIKLIATRLIELIV